MPVPNEYVCIKEKDIADLEARAEFKEERIKELIEDNKRIESKIDKLTETVNKVVLNSIQDDNNLKQRVLALETKIETQDKVLKQYKKEAQKHRDEERAKTNQRLTFITVGIAVLTFILTYLWK